MNNSNSTVIELEILELHDEPLEGRALDLSYYMASAVEEEKDVVTFRQHSFFEGIFAAWRNHKSITLSPDIIWLIILQGFTHHLDENSENLRSMFVSFEGMKTLTVKRPELIPETATQKDWAGIIDEFIEKIGENTGKQITDTLEPKFSTTTPVSHTARSQPFPLLVESVPAVIQISVIVMEVVKLELQIRLFLFFF